MAAAPLNLIPWKSVEEDPRWAEAPTYLRDEYLARWEQSNLERVQQAGADEAIVERIKSHATTIRNELYPSEIALSEQTRAAASQALQSGVPSQEVMADTPPSQTGDVAAVTGQLAEQVRAQRRKIIEDLNAEFEKEGRSHRAKLTEDNGDGIMRIQAPVIEGTESDDQPRYDMPPEVDAKVEQAANKLKGYNMQLMRLGVFRPPSGIKEEYRDLPFGGVLSTQLIGNLGLQTAGVIGMLRDFAGAGAKPGDLEASLANMGTALKEAASAPEGATSSIARGAGTVGSLIGGGFTTAAMRAAAEAYESTLVATGNEQEAKTAALKTAPAMLLFFGAGKFAGNMASRLAGPDASALTRGLLGFGGATVANIGASSVLRALDAPDGQAWEAAKPTVETLTVDTLFAAMHGFGDYGKARDTARQRAEAELRRRGFTKEQFEEWYFANMKRAGVPGVPKGKEAEPVPGEKPLIETPAERVVPEGEQVPPPEPTPRPPSREMLIAEEPNPERRALLQQIETERGEAAFQDTSDGMRIVERRVREAEQRLADFDSAQATDRPTQIANLQRELETELDAFGESEASAAIRERIAALQTPNELPEPQQVTTAPEPAPVETSQPAGTTEAPAPTGEVVEAGSEPARASAAAPVEGAGAPVIVSTAIRNPDGSLATGPKINTPHKELIRTHLQAGGDPTTEVILDNMGFKVRDSDGTERFATREEAYDIAEKSGQLAEPAKNRRLASEILKEAEAPTPGPVEEPPITATSTPAEQRGAVTLGEAEIAAAADSQRARLERLADFHGAEDAELVASQAITDVLESLPPGEAADTAKLTAALTNRVKQVAEDARRRSEAVKRGGGEKAASIEGSEEGAEAKTISDPAPSSKPDKQTQRRELQLAIEEEANNLPARDREILFGIQEGRNLSEIANGLGISPQAAQKRWVNVQKKLQSRLARFRGEEGAILNPLGQGFTRRATVPPPVTLSSLLTEPYARGSLRRRAAMAWLGKHGALPPEMRNALERGGRNEAAMKSQFSMLANDLRAAVDAHARGDAAVRQSTLDTVSDFMEGDPAGIAAMRALPPRIQDTAQRARLALDTVSEALVDEGALPRPLANVVIGNVGSWLRRYYAAFDESANWNLDNLRERAAGTGPEAVEAQRILSNAESHIRQQSLLMGQPSSMRTPEAIDATMRALTDRNQLESYLFGTGAMNADVSSYLHRRTIAPEIRALMGEEKNPLLRTERSGAFLSQAIARHRMQQTLRQVGLMAGAFSLSRRGRYSMAVPAPNPGRSPWRGLWTTPEMAAAMGEARLYGDDVTTATGLMSMLYTKFVGDTKANLVALNPRSTIVNAMGGGFQSIANGLLIRIPGTGVGLWKGARDAFNAVFRGDGTFDPTAADAAWRERVRHIHTELQNAGVLDSSVTVRDFETSVGEALQLDRLPSDQRTVDRAVGAVRGAATGYAGTLAATGSRTAGAVGAAAGAVGGAVAGSERITRAQRAIGRALIGTPDAFWKALNWLDNYAHQIRAGRPLRQAAEIATERTSNTMPTYSKIPEGLRRVWARIPLANVFFQFSWELIRNNINNVRYAMRDLASDNPVDKKHGARRLLGLALLAGGVAAFINERKRKNEWTPAKDKAFRESFAPEWDRNGIIIPMNVAGSVVSYVNGKYMIPQLMFAEMMQAGTSGENPAHATGKVMGALLDDFLRSNAALDPANEALNNRRMDTGKAITTETGWRGALERFEYFAKKTMAPGVAQEVGKMRMAVTGEQAGYGRTYSMAERMQGLMGVRLNSYDLKQQLSFRLSDLDRQWNEISKRENTELKRIVNMRTAAPTEYTERAASIRENADRQRGELQLRAVKLYRDAYEVGLSSGDVARAMNDKRTRLPVDLRLAYIARKLREQGKESLTVEELRAMRRGQAP